LWPEGQENGAGEQIRTVDVHLGKVVLYQLSYARKKDGLNLLFFALLSTGNFEKLASPPRGSDPDFNCDWQQPKIEMESRKSDGMTERGGQPVQPFAPIRSTPNSEAPDYSQAVPPGLPRPNDDVAFPRKPIFSLSFPLS
jgi:hypothetical protein